MKQFRLVDNVLGWFTFLIAAFVYCSTIEPTASFWDCPEFITTGYRLEVGHPPGAPFFMLTANLFSQFTSNPGQVAYWVNIQTRWNPPPINNSYFILKIDTGEVCHIGI